MPLQTDDPLQPSGAGTDYGYIGGGMYIPTPYQAPPPPKPPKKKAAAPVYPPKGTGSTYDEQVPKYTPSPSPYPPKGTGSTYNEQVPKYTPTAKAAAQTAITNTAASSGGGGSSGGGSGSGVSVNATQAAATTPDTPAAAPPATTRDVVIPDITLDPTYQAQVAALAQQLTDAQTANTASKNDYDITYNSTLQNLGWDAAKNQFMANTPTTQYGSAYRGNLEDYTGRGLGYSSDYVKDLGNLNSTFTGQVGQLGTARQSFDQAQDASLGTATSQNTEAKSNALIQAAARVAASLGIDQSQVPTSGGKKTITVPITQPGTGG